MEESAEKQDSTTNLILRRENGEDDDRKERDHHAATYIPSVSLVHKCRFDNMGREMRRTNSMRS